MLYVYRLYYVLLGKYDLLLTVDAEDEDQADLLARKEIKKDLIPDEDCKLIECEMIRVARTP